MKIRHKRFLAIFIIGTILYLVFAIVNLPQPLSLAGENRRIFSLYTETNIWNTTRILSVTLSFIVSKENVAIGAYSVALTSTGQALGTFIMLFILPHGVEVIPSANQNVTNSPYSTDVQALVSMKSTSRIQIVETDFEWANFSQSLRLFEWGYSINLSAFDSFFDSWIGRDFYSILNRDLSPINLHISLSLPLGYRITETYPSAEASYENSAVWSGNSPVLNFFASGTYQERYRYFVDFGISTIAPLLIGLVGGLIMGLAMPVSETRKSNIPGHKSARVGRK